MKKIISLLGMALLCFLIAQPVRAQEYDCNAGKHHDIISAFTDATVTYTCQLCGRWYTDNLPPDGHLWDEWVIQKAPTCTADGRRYHTCQLHTPHSDYEVIPAAGHRYMVTTKAPACDTPGEQINTCTACGHSYIVDYGEPTGHNYTEKITAASCEQPGVKTIVCAGCGDTYTEEIPVLQHLYGEWIIETQATAETDGSRYQECEHGCGRRIYEGIPALAVVTPPRPEDDSFLTTAIVIYSIDLVLLSAVLLTLIPMISAITWEKRKQQIFLKKVANRRKEDERYGYR